MATNVLNTFQRKEIRELSNSEKQNLVDKILRAQKITTANALSKSEALRPRFHSSESGESYILVDSGVINSTMCGYLGAIIECLSDALELPIKVVSDATYEFQDDKASDDFLIGFIQGITADAKYRPKLRTDKKNMDLGKATAFFLRLRGEVLRGAGMRVTLEGLKTFHAFLGNDPSRADGDEKRARMSPLLKVLQAMFIHVQSYQARWRDYYDLITTALSHLGLHNFDDEQRKDTIMHYMKSYDDIVHNFDQIAYSVDKKGKKKVVGVRRPRKPNPSPTMLNFEFVEFVDKIIGAHWQNLESYKKDFKERVYTEGYKPVYDYVRSEYQARFETVRNFSNLTTKRLQEARSAGLIKPNSKKTDFTDAVRTEFFMKRDPDNRVSLFYSELKKLIPPESRYSTLTRYLSSISSTPTEGSREEVDKRMEYTIAMAYAKHSISTGNFQKTVPAGDPVRGKKCTEVLDTYSKVRGLVSHIIYRFDDLRRLATKRKELVLRQKNYLILKGDLETLSKLLDKMSWVDRDAQEMWECFYSQLTGKSSPQRYAEHIREEIRKQLTILKEGSSRYSIVFGCASDRKELIQDLESKFAELKI